MIHYHASDITILKKVRVLGMPEDYTFNSKSGVFKRVNFLSQKWSFYEFSLQIQNQSQKSPSFGLNIYIETKIVIMFETGGPKSRFLKQRDKNSISSTLDLFRWIVGSKHIKCHYKFSSSWSDQIHPPEDSLASNYPWVFPVIPQAMPNILQTPECLPSSWRIPLLTTRA